MKYAVVSISALFLAVCSYAQSAPPAPAKTGIIYLRTAILSTQEGRKALADLHARFEPTKTRLAKQQAAIQADQSSLNQGNNTLSAEQKEKLMREIDRKVKTLDRETQYAEAQFDEEQAKIMEELGQRIMVVIDKYSVAHGYSLILDVGAQQTPVLFASNNITSDVVKLFDQNSAATK
jgi:Skp family chaperone for outer membrane proteins